MIKCARTADCLPGRAAAMNLPFIATDCPPVDIIIECRLRSLQRVGRAGLHHFFAGRDSVADEWLVLENSIMLENKSRKGVHLRNNSSSSNERQLTQKRWNSHSGVVSRQRLGGEAFEYWCSRFVMIQPWLCMLYQGVMILSR